MKLKVKRLRRNSLKVLYTFSLLLFFVILYDGIHPLSLPQNDNQHPYISVLVSNFDEVSIVLVHGYYVKDLKIFVGGMNATRQPYHFPIVEMSETYVKGRLVIYHSNLKGEKLITIEAEYERGELYKDIYIIYLHITVSLQIESDGTVTLRGSVSTENYTVSSSVVTVTLPTGEMFSSITDKFGNFIVVVPYASSYIVKAHGGHVVDANGSFIEDVVICSTFEIVKAISS